MNNLSIDPTEIDDSNLKSVMVAFLFQMSAFEEKQNTLISDVAEIRDLLQVFKLSRCNLLPWISRNRWLLATIISSYAALDWIIRAIQWALFPPA